MQLRLMAWRTRMAPVAVALALGGCVTGGDGPSAPSSSSSGGSTLANLLAFNSTSAPEAPPPASTDTKLECPDIEVQDGTSSLRIYGAGEPTNGNVRYQFSMGDVARECIRSGSDILIKVGVQGRVLLGPVGAPGAFNIPVRIAVRAERDGKPVVSKLYQVPASVPAGQSQSEFQFVSEPLSVPFTQARSQDDYTVLVGFDSQGHGAAEPKARRRRAAARTPQG